MLSRECYPSARKWCIMTVTGWTIFRLHRLQRYLEQIVHLRIPASFRHSVATLYLRDSDIVLRRWLGEPQHRAVTAVLSDGIDPQDSSVQILVGPATSSCRWMMCNEVILPTVRNTPSAPDAGMTPVSWSPTFCPERTPIPVPRCLTLPLVIPMWWVHRGGG